jgi:signal transduction histidine kinase
MRRDDLPSRFSLGRQGPFSWIWLWASSGAGAVLALKVSGAELWAWNLTWLAWTASGGLWFQRDARQVVSNNERALVQFLSQIDEAKASPRTDFPFDWLCGWYWETSASHELVCLRPGAQVDAAQSCNWPALTELISTQPLLWACWGGALERVQPELNRLQFSLMQAQPWEGDLVLPWPSALAMLFGEQDLNGQQCALRIAPRFDRHGTLLGHCGTLRLLPSGLAAAHSSVVAESHQAMGDGEQEAMRYALSHDLRAPLRAVEGFTRIVKEDYGRLLDRIGHDHLDRVLAASARMNAMIDAILSQAQLAGAPLDRRDIDLSAMAQEVGGEMAALTPGRGPVSLVVAQGMHAQADGILLRRVLENLIGNAIKYSAKVDAPAIEVGLMPATNPAVFFVRDNGAGFDMQHADKLFGLFQRLHSSKDFPGSGVGLAGVQHIIRRHGGRVWAEARPGQGACFYFTLMDTAQAQSIPLRSD